jgi:hypothetical protein
VPRHDHCFDDMTVEDYVSRWMLLGLNWVQGHCHWVVAKRSSVILKLHLAIEVEARWTVVGYYWKQRDYRWRM